MNSAKYITSYFKFDESTIQHCWYFNRYLLIEYSLCNAFVAETWPTILYFASAYRKGKKYADLLDLVGVVEKDSYFDKVRIICPTKIAKFPDPTSLG